MVKIIQTSDNHTWHRFERSGFSSIHPWGGWQLIFLRIFFESILNFLQQYFTRITRSLKGALKFFFRPVQFETKFFLNLPLRHKVKHFNFKAWFNFGDSLHCNCLGWAYFWSNGTNIFLTDHLLTAKIVKKKKRALGYIYQNVHVYNWRLRKCHIFLS